MHLPIVQIDRSCSHFLSCDLVSDTPNTNLSKICYISIVWNFVRVLKNRKILNANNNEFITHETLSIFFEAAGMHHNACY